MIRKLVKRLALPLVLYGGLVVFLFSTDPTKLSIGWLLLPFIWLFAALFVTFRMFFRRFARNQGKINFYSVLAASIAPLILLLSSIDQLTVQDGLILMALLLVGMFYASKINFKG